MVVNLRHLKLFKIDPREVDLQFEGSHSLASQIRVVLQEFIFSEGNFHLFINIPFSLIKIFYCHCVVVH